MDRKGSTDYPEKEKTGARGCAPVYINGIRAGNHPITMRRVVYKRKNVIFGAIKVEESVLICGLKLTNLPSLL